MDSPKSQLKHGPAWICDFSHPEGDEFFAVESDLSGLTVCQGEREENL